MKKFLIWFFAILAFFIASVLIYLSFYGLFYTSKFTLQVEGGEHVAYRQVTGSYQLSGFAMDSLYNDLKNEVGIESFLGIGTYYDNPQIVEASNLRSDIGCIIEPSDTSKLAKMKSPFHLRIPEIKEYIVTDFPYKGKMSIVLGAIKVYPKLEDFCNEKGYDLNLPVTEIYDISNHIIHYRRDKN